MFRENVGVEKIMGVGHTYRPSRGTFVTVRAVGENFIKN